MVFDVVFVQAEDGIRDLVRSRGLGDVYKRQGDYVEEGLEMFRNNRTRRNLQLQWGAEEMKHGVSCLLYTSDAADERSSVDLGGRRIIKKKKS